MDKVWTDPRPACPLNMRRRHSRGFRSHDIRRRLYICHLASMMPAAPPDPPYTLRGLGMLCELAGEGGTPKFRGGAPSRPGTRVPTTLVFILENNLS